MDIEPMFVLLHFRLAVTVGYDLHHNEQPGVLQLVNEETHQNTGHTGGREIWGGGSEYR